MGNTRFSLNANAVTSGVVVLLCLNFSKQHRRQFVVAHALYPPLLVANDEIRQHFVDLLCD